MIFMYRVLKLLEDLLCGYSKISFTCSYFQVLKAVVAQFDAGELITQREMVSARVNSELTARAEQVRVLCTTKKLLHTRCTEHLVKHNVLDTGWTLSLLSFLFNCDICPKGPRKLCQAPQKSIEVHYFIVFSGSRL